MNTVNQLWDRLGIRRQLTITAIALVALPLCLGIFVLANLLTRSLTNSLTDTTTEVARRTATYVADHGAAALPGDLELDEGYRVQLLTRSGTLVWSSSPKLTQPLSELRPQVGQTQHEGGVMYWGPADGEGRDLVVAHSFATERGDYTVLAATNQSDQHDAVNLTVALLLSSVPLFMLLAAVVTWWLVGRALRPVDDLTRRVGRITSTVGDERVRLPEADDELRHLGQTMNSMLDRLQAAQRSQRSFVSDASHELRSPVASLSGAIEIASHADDLQTWRELSPLMASEVHRLDQLVHGLLALSRADDSGLTLALGDVDLDDLALDEVRRLRAASDKQVVARVSPARVVADPALVRQLLVNLGDNAVRHAASTVQLTVLQTGDGGAMVQVDDDGSGVPEGDRERIFDRFVRLEESRNRDQGGSGLGLAIVEQIVRAHRGRVEVLDSPLGGAAFVVHLPSGE